jgi:hypothetical protein
MEQRGLTIVSVINGTGVHDFGSERGGIDEKALILDRIIFRVGARSILVVNILNWGI